MNKDFKEILITEEQIKNQVKQIGEMIDAKYGNEEVVIVGLLKGSYVFTADVARAIKNPNVFVEFIVASSYKNGDSTGEVRIVLDTKRPVYGKHVIIVEDIIDTGRTLAKVKQMFVNRGAKTVEIATMCTKPARRVVHVTIDYPTFEIPDEIVVGYGLDYNEHYRHLPYVAAITEEFFKKGLIK